MKKLLLLFTLAVSSISYAQENYIGWTHDSLVSFHSKYFETISNTDSSLLVKNKQSDTQWRYFKFDSTGKCILATKDMQYIDDVVNLEKKLKSKGFKKNANEAQLDVGNGPIKGTLYTKGKENYIVLYSPICPKLTAATRTIVYYKTK